MWNLNKREDSSTGCIEHSLQGHTRAITDVNFSAHHPDLLATCSVDGYVHWWDLRRPRQPALTFCDWFAGATQVKFNRQNPHIIASAHDRWLHIWDERRACEPIRSITAHTSKIYGLDWNRTRETGIVTCSLDKSIKFWDYGTEGDEPEHIIETDFPVWRARHTPFGWGLLAMPQNESGELHLYDRLWSDDSPVNAKPEPVATFPGHGDHKAKEFLWRSRGGISDDNMDHREFQLVSWGGDNELRLHCVDAETLASVGHIKDGPARKEMKLTRQGATYKTFRAIDDVNNRDRKAGTMSDHRTASGAAQKPTTTVRPSTHHHRHHRGAWRGPSMKARVASSKNGNRNQTQIGWMKGITMTKRNRSKDGSRDGTAEDPLDPAFPEAAWEKPDTIQDELLRINTKLPKVNWENIDLDNLTLNALLKGPWGQDGESIFIKVKIDIPSEYPLSKAPKFNIEKSSFMPEETHEQITKEVHELADQFLKRKQNCLEVTFTYLLGEVDLESSTTFFKNVRDLDDEMDALADESSSDDDEDMQAGGSTSLSQELGTAGDADTTIAPPVRTIMPPPPRTCGARFSNNGKLICFFPTKEEKARALFSNAGDIFKERPKGETFFAGFGRLNQEGGPKAKYTTDETSATEDQSETSDSDGGSSTSSSSDSEGTSINNMNVWYRSSRQLRRTWSEDRSVRSSNAGTGTGVGTGTGTGITRRRIGRSRNLVSIHDVRAELPSKQELAEEYAIFGDGADVCEHNARVAEKYESFDLMSIWQYLALLLRKGIPLELVGSGDSRDSVLVIARDTVAKSRAAFRSGRALLGRVKWGQHPLAKSIVMDLFIYFENIGDIQMLAMLSCIFSQSTADDGVAYAEMRIPEQATPLQLKAPSFSLSYFPQDAANWVRSHSYSNSAVTTPGTLHTPLHYGGSQVSDDNLWVAETAGNSFSCGETPPSKPKSDEMDQSLLSKSPNARTLQKTNTGLASAFTANLTRPFSVMASSSPPATQSRKKPSPAEAILNSLAPRTGSSGVASQAVAESGDGRTTISDEDYRYNKHLPLVPTSVSVIVEDQAIFDDDGWLSSPMLDPSLESLYANYRYAYAEMLQMWGQPLARLEVMKFNVLKEDVTSGFGEESLHDSITAHEGTNGGTASTIRASSPIIMGKKELLHNLAVSGKGLDVTGICRVHETQLEPLRYTSTTEINIGGAVGTCDRCHKSQTQLRCVYCLEPVDALFPPCLGCGCASHEDCLGEWHAAGETLCPAGDECNCVEEAANGQVESWAALRAMMLKSQGTPASVRSESDPAISAEKDRNHLWARNGSASPTQPPVKAASASPASIAFAQFRRTTGTWGRMASQKRTTKRT